MSSAPQTLLDAAESVCDAAHPSGRVYCVPDYLIAALQIACDEARAHALLAQLPAPAPSSLIPSIPHSLSAQPCASAR